MTTEERGKTAGEGQPSELAKFRELAGQAGIDAEKLFGELKAEFSKEVDEKLKALMSETFEGLKGLVGDIENRLAQQMTNEAQKAVADAVAEFRRRAIEGGAGEAGTAGVGRPGGAGDLLSVALQNPDKIATLINAFRQPSTEQQLGSIFRVFLQGMSFGQKMKSGEMSPGDVEKVFGAITGEDKTGKK